MNKFIEKAIEEKRPVRIITTNGFQMRGKIVEDTQNSLTFISDGREMVVYKHAISTICSA